MRTAVFELVAPSLKVSARDRRVRGLRLSALLLLFYVVIVNFSICVRNSDVVVYVLSTLEGLRLYLSFLSHGDEVLPASFDARLQKLFIYV